MSLVESAMSENSSFQLTTRNSPLYRSNTLMYIIKLSCHFEVITPDSQGFKPTIILECMNMNVSLCV